MKALSKEKRDQLILTGLLTLAALAGLWFGLISLQKKALTQVTLRIQEQKTKVQSADKLVRSGRDLQNQLDAAREKLRNIEQGMAVGDMYSWIFLTMNKFKANRNVDIPQFSREVATDAGILPHFPYRAVLFNLRGTAYYHDLGKFLADFENTYPFLRVQNLELEPVGGSSTAGAAATATSTPRESEKLAFRMEIVALVNPNTH